MPPSSHRSLFYSLLIVSMHPETGVVSDGADSETKSGSNCGWGRSYSLAKLREKQTCVLLCKW